MMKRIFFVLLALCSLQYVSAQKMRHVFAHMPDTVLNLLTENNRLDCIDFIENNVEAKVRNRLDGFSVLNKLTDNYLQMQLTASMQVEMKLLSGNDSLEYIALVKTFTAPARSSVVSFYNLDWQKLPAGRFLKLPDFDSFWKPITEGDSIALDSVAALKKKMDLRLVAASLSDKDESLTFSLQPVNLEKEDSVKISNQIRPVVYMWDRKAFVPVELKK